MLSWVNFLEYLYPSAASRTPRLPLMGYAASTPRPREPARTPIDPSARARAGTSTSATARIFFIEASRSDLRQRRHGISNQDAVSPIVHTGGLFVDAVSGEILKCRLPFGPLAQLVEQRTFNPLVAGSNPARPTNPIGGLPKRLTRGRARMAPVKSKIELVRVAASPELMLNGVAV